MTTPPVFCCAGAELDRDVITLGGAEGRHAAVTRRLVPGELVRLTDGAGRLADCEVTAVSASAAQVELAVRSRRDEPRPDPRIAVVQAIAKGERAELAVGLMTEAGVDTIIPWAAERCVPVWRGDRGERALGRWRASAREAAKQSRRYWFPDVLPLAATRDVARIAGSAALALLLDPAGGPPLATAALPARGEIVVIVGPEGGISPAETQELTGAGAVAARLGPQILRTSTAGAVAAALLLSRTGRWA